jgi:hypothetical protein
MREVLSLDDVEPQAPPKCPGCGHPMIYYGGTAGFIHCGWKLLFRAGGWFDTEGLHVRDERLAGSRQDGGRRDVSGLIEQRVA